MGNSTCIFCLYNFGNIGNTLLLNNIPASAKTWWSERQHYDNHSIKDIFARLRSLEGNLTKAQVWSLFK